MKDYEYLFTRTLHQKLKEKIIGKIFVTVNHDDELRVEIESFGDFTFRTKLDNFSDRILNGLTTDYVAYDIVKQYKSFIAKKYFM